MVPLVLNITHGAVISALYIVRVQNADMQI